MLIFISNKAEDLRRVFSSYIEDFPVIIEEMGTFRALKQK
jgi:hypothetical protein